MDVIFLYYVIYACWRIWHESKANQVALLKGEPVEFDDGKSYLGWTVGAALAVALRSILEGAVTGWAWGGRVNNARRAKRRTRRAERTAQRRGGHGRSVPPDPPPAERTGGDDRTDDEPEPAPTPDDRAGAGPRTEGEPGPAREADAPKLDTRPADRPRVDAGGWEPVVHDGAGPGVLTDGTDRPRCADCGGRGEPFNKLVDVGGRHVHEHVCVRLRPRRPPAAGDASGTPAPYLHLVCRRCGVPLLEGEALVCGDCLARAAPAGPPPVDAPALPPAVVDVEYWQVVTDGVVSGQGDVERLVTWDELAPFAGDLPQRLQEATARGDAAEIDRLADQLYDLALAVLDGTAVPPAGTADVAEPQDETPAAEPDPSAPPAGQSVEAPQLATTTTTETPAPAEPEQAPDPASPGTTPGPGEAGLAPGVPPRPAQWTAVLLPNTPGPTYDPDRRPAAGGLVTGGIQTMAMTTSGETTDIKSTRRFFEELGEHVKADILSQLELCVSSLSTAEMEDEDVMSAIARTRGFLSSAAGSGGTESVLEALEAHRLMEHAVASTPGAASTDYYRGG